MLTTRRPLSSQRSRLARLPLAILTVGACSLLAVSCTKKDELASGSGALLDNAMLAAIPPSSLGFVTWESYSDAYKKFRDSFWGAKFRDTSLVQAKEHVSKIENPDDRAQVESFIRVVEKSGFVSADGRAEQLTNEGAAFINLDKQEKRLSAGAYVSAAPSVDFKPKLASLESALQSEGFAPAKETFANAEGFSVPLKLGSHAGDAAELLPAKAYIATDGKRMAVATSKMLAERVFSGTPPDGGAKSIKDSPQFQAALAEVGDAAKQISFGFLDVTRFSSELEGLGAKPEDVQELKNLPVESVVYGRSADPMMSDTFAMRLTPKDPNHKKYMDALAGTGQSQLLRKLPSDVLVFVGFDGGTLVNVKNVVLAEAPAETTAGVKDFLPMIDSVTGVGLGVRAAGGASPFPEILVAVESDKSADLQQLLNQMLTASLEGSGMPASAWQEKDISGTKVRFMLTPFGVGAYVAALNNMVVIASSEKMIADLAAVAKGGAALSSAMPKGADLLLAGKPALLAYSNITRLADVILATQESLSMFTGGQSFVDQKQIDRMKNVGSVAAALNVQNSAIKFRNVYDTPVSPAS